MTLISAQYHHSLKEHHKQHQHLCTTRWLHAWVANMHMITIMMLYHVQCLIHTHNKCWSAPNEGHGTAPNQLQYEVNSNQQQKKHFNCQVHLHMINIEPTPIKLSYIKRLPLSLRAGSPPAVQLLAPRKPVPWEPESTRNESSSKMDGVL